MFMTECRETEDRLAVELVFYYWAQTLDAPDPLTDRF